MQFTTKSQAQHTDCLIIFVSELRKLSTTGTKLKQTSIDCLSNILGRGNMDGRVGQTLLLYDIPEVGAERVLLAGLGKAAEIDESVFARVIKSIYQALADSAIEDAHINLHDITVKDRDVIWKTSQTIIQINTLQYRFEQTKNQKSDHNVKLNKLSFNLNLSDDRHKIETTIQQSMAIAAGMDLARDLGNLPGNICTPSYLAEQARLLAKDEKKLTVTVLEEADMQTLGMGSLLSVSAGSRQPAKLITLKYQGTDSRHKPIVLVGKGVTFDTGGISLKPGDAMDEMKFDMCGAASVIGTIRAIIEMELPINVVGLIPATENMPDGLATKPGDIVTSLSGQTIEILNTDAEGRLILCDALTYAKKFNPHCVIDIATLTGACIIALGKVPSAILGNHQPLINQLIECGQQTTDKVWQLPLWDEYQKQLKSNFADMANIGGRDAGTITAACFLSRFTEDYHWAHLDIAGTAWKSGDQKGATGRPVPLLTTFILNQIPTQSVNS